MIKPSAGGVAGDIFQMYKYTLSSIAGRIKNRTRHYEDMNKQTKHQDPPLYPFPALISPPH
jgi:hypothetical protein